LSKTAIESAFTLLVALVNVCELYLGPRIAEKLSTSLIAPWPVCARKPVIVSWPALVFALSLCA
jgi:hypothetical protein